MLKSDRDKLHKQHTEYLFEQMGIDRIIEDRYIYISYDGTAMSEYVTDTGGDVVVYRVEGINSPFRVFSR